MAGFGLAALLPIGFVACSAGTETHADDTVPTKTVGAPLPAGPKARRHVEVQVYAMSMCPFTAQFMANVAPLRDLFDVDLRVDFMGGVGPKGDLSSLRGEPELTGDRYQICAEAHAPKWLDVLLCQDEDLEHTDTNWSGCARQVGVDDATIAKVEACATGEESTTLLTASFESARRRGVGGTPTIFVDGESYTGPRGLRGFVKGICSKWMTQPEACRALPPLEVTILTDARCTDCDTDLVVKNLESRLDGPSITIRDIASPEGAGLYSKLGGANLPAVVIDAAAPLGGDASAFKSATRVGPNLYYSTGSWNPVCHDPAGCQRAECKSRLSCMAEEPLTVDLYMMGLCPFAAKGITALGPIFDRLEAAGEHPKLRVHFIGGVDEKGQLTSMHGPNEVEEDLRDICVADHAPDSGKLLAYLRCRAADFKQDWKKCAGGKTGIDAPTIETCAASEDAKTRLTASFASSKAEGMNASPMWVANARYPFRGVKPVDLEAGICDHNESVAKCRSTSP